MMIMQAGTYAIYVMNREMIDQRHMDVKYDVWESIRGSYAERSRTYASNVRKIHVKNP